MREENSIEARSELPRDRIRRRSRYAAVFAILTAAFCIIVVWNVNTGNVQISVGQILKILFGGAEEGVESNIIWKIRLPRIFMAAILIASLFIPSASAVSNNLSHTVVKGDTMWKLAVKYQVGVSEIIKANSHIANPDLIYPGQVLSIPQLDTTVTAFENEVIRLVNKIRQENGLKSLSANWELSRVARYKSQDMVDNRYFAHNSPVYGTPFQMIKSFGISYRTAGENIAYGYKTPQAVVDGWMNSSGHRANILNSSYTQIGVGYVANGNYWTQMFIG